MHETNVYAGRLSIFFAAAKRPQKKCMKRTNNAVVESFCGAEFRRGLDKATKFPSPYLVWNTAKVLIRIDLEL